MQPTRRRHFAPGQNEELIGELHHGRSGPTETDYDLFLDTDTRAYFVVRSRSVKAGSTLTNSHTRYALDEFLAAHPSHRARTVEMLQHVLSLTVSRQRYSRNRV